MALGFSGGGEFTPHIRYMASTSSWALSQETGEKPKTIQLKEFIADLENVGTGWCRFDEGHAPQWVMNQDPKVFGPRPSEEKDAQGTYKWKQGFKLLFFSPSTFGEDGLREFATNATGPCMGIDALHDTYLAAKDANPGKVPVVSFNGSVPAKVGKGNTTVPQFTIVKWVDRPAALTTTGNNVVNMPVQQAPAAPAQAAKPVVNEF